jgi:hypothetical protein
VNAATPPTPENVAEMFTEGDNDYHDGYGWHPSLSADGNVIKIGIEAHDEEGERLPEVHFRAVVVEGETAPIVLPAGAAADYINGDDGHHWLTCGTCEVSLMEVTAGTYVWEMAEKIAAHRCAETAQEAGAL